MPILAGRESRCKISMLVGDQLREWGVLQNTTARIGPSNKVYSSSDGDGVAESIQVASYHGDNP